LIYFCFQESGISVPRLVSDQASYGTAVDKADLKPGDVLFFSVDTPGKAEYVGIYIGSGGFIAARSSTSSIGQMDMNSAYFSERYVGARRYY
jgi:peptidoglycan endopeptidase LytF